MLPLAVSEEGKGGKCIGYWGTRGKRWGSGKSIGSWVMKRKEIGWLLGDKGEGGYMFASICIKTKYISQKHDNKPVCAKSWAWTAGGRRSGLLFDVSHL